MAKKTKKKQESEDLFSTPIKTVEKPIKKQANPAILELVDRFLMFLEQDGSKSDYLKAIAKYRHLGEASGKKQLEALEKKVREYLCDNYTADEDEALVTAFCWQSSDKGKNYWSNVNFNWTSTLRSRKGLGRKK